MLLRIKYDDTTTEALPYPSEDIEKVDNSYSEQLCSNQLNVGDAIDCYFQDGAYKKAWSRGYVAYVSDDGQQCDVVYSDNYYESNIPHSKIRLVKRCDSSGKWMVDKSVLLEWEDSSDDSISFRSGTVSAIQQGRQCRIIFSDGSSTVVSFPEAARAVFRFHTKDFPDKKQYVWPVAANTLSMAEAVKQRRQTRNRQKAIQTMPRQSQQIHQRGLGLKREGLLQMHLRLRDPIRDGHFGVVSVGVMPLLQRITLIIGATET